MEEMLLVKGPRSSTMHRTDPDALPRLKRGST